MRLTRIVWAVVVLLACLGPAAAQQSPSVQAQALVRAELVAEAKAIVPGETLVLGIRMAMKPGWHVYWRNPGDSGLAPDMAWRLPRGLVAGAFQWPVPERIPVQHLMNYGYEGETMLLVPLSVAADLAKEAGPDGRLTLAGTLSYLVCEDVCFPGSAELSLTLPVTAKGASLGLDPDRAALFAATRAKLPVAAPAPVQFAGQGKRIVLSLEAKGLTPEAVSAAAFFPYAETVLDNAAPQDLRVDATGLHLSLKLGEGSAAPKTIPGVLVFTENGTRRAFAVGTETPKPVAASAPEDSLTLLGAIGLALLGGLVLNLMPCVFPVLSIKVLSLVHQAGQSTARVRLHGLAYTAGVLASFLALAGILIALKAGGATIGWGFQLQSPLVVAALAYGLLAMGLSLSGVVHVGGGIAGLGDGLTRRAGYQGSFFTGVLATLVATPCTAPFMGAAVGFALTQGPLVGLSVFASLGLGLALTFLALTLFPGAVRLLPRPGAWMDTLKGVLAFPVYATVAWLVWVLAQQVGPNGLLATLLGLVLVGLAAWTWERARDAGRVGGLVGRAVAIAALAATIGLALLSDRDRDARTGFATADGVEVFTQARLDALREAGRTVFVDMTAAWCITCQVNERAVLARDNVKAAFKAGNVAVLKGDWTNQNPEITRLLGRYGRSGVPLYLVYRDRGEAKILPQILTEGIVVGAIEPSGT